MKVLYVLPKPRYFADGPGGRVTHAMGVATGLAANGIPVCVLSGQKTEAAFSSHRSIEAKEVKFKNTRHIGMWTRALIESLVSTLEQDTDIASVLVRYAVSNAPFLVPVMTRFRRHKWVFEVNSLAFHQLHYLPWSVRRTYLRLEQWVLDHADGVYVVSEQLKRDIAHAGRRLPATKLIVIPNGGPEPLWHRVSGTPSYGTVRFVYLGLFHEYYELPLVLEVFADISRAVKNVELHLYGDGPGKVGLERRARVMQNVWFHGRFDLEVLLENGELTANDVLVLPYAPKDRAFQSPIKLYEYMALGLPIVASSIGQIARILYDGETGRLYTPGDKQSLREAMMSTAQDPQARSRMMEYVRREYSQSYTWKSRMRALTPYLLGDTEGPAD